jgi:hypothetical protein
MSADTKARRGFYRCRRARAGAGRRKGPDRLAIGRRPALTGRARPPYAELVKAAIRRTTPAPEQKPPPQHDAPVYGITTADEPLSADIARRQKQYLISMGFRLVAIAVVVWVPGIAWQLKVVLGVVATVIPFFAVVSANGAPTRGDPSTNLLLAPPAPPAIEGPDHAIGPGEEFLAGDFVAGESVRREDDAPGRTGSAESADEDAPA